MPCPYFHPSEPRSLPFHPRAAMLPLGDHWAGACHATAEPLAQPGALILALCNLGYARETCRYFPQGEGPDAVRFTVSGDDGATLRLYYVVERNHHPFQHGRLEYRRATQAFADCTAGQLLVAQARAYVASYLMRKSAADSDAGGRFGGSHPG